VTAFATYSDLEARLGITMTNPEQTRATTLLNTSSDLVRAAVRQQIDLVTDDVYVRRGSWDSRLRLPERPCVSVTSVVARSPIGVDLPIVTPGFFLDGDDLIRYTGPTYSFDTGRGWFGPAYQLTITYTHGFAVVPALAKVVAVEAAARVWVNPEGATQANVAGAMYAYADTGMMLTEDEEEDLVERFRRKSGSVTLR